MREEGVAMRATLLQREPVPEDLVPTAIRASPKDSTEEGLTCPPETTVCEVDWAVWRGGLGGHFYICPECEE
jgi:hypothetical protein